MELYVDGEQRPVPEDAGPTLEDVLRAVQVTVSGSGRAMTTINLDGTEMLPDAEAENVSRPAADFQKIEIITADAADWGRHGLGEAASALGQLADEFNGIADQLRGGNRAEAVSSFMSAVEAYGQIVTAMVNAAGLASVKTPEGFEESLQKVTTAMKDMAPEIQAEDSVAAADLAEYEVAEAMCELAELVKGMAG